jgi:hypothetical protein
MFDRPSVTALTALESVRSMQSPQIRRSLAQLIINGYIKLKDDKVVKCFGGLYNRRLTPSLMWKIFKFKIVVPKGNHRSK